MKMIVRLRKPYEQQSRFLSSNAPRRVVRAGRRSGKTTMAAILAVKRFLAGQRILYAVPTQEQVERFWFEVKRALVKLIEVGPYYKNETMHVIERIGTEQRIRAKTAFNADTLRGDYADLLILDEFHLMNEDAWGIVGAPMLLDNRGDAVFIYTPPSIRTRSVTKAQDPMHAAKMFKKAAENTSGRWETFSFTSHDNPYLDKIALSEIAQDMTERSYRQEILAEDIEDVIGALWKLDQIEDLRVMDAGEMDRIVLGWDPSTTSKHTSDEHGIIIAGIRKGEGYILEDLSGIFTPEKATEIVVDAYYRWNADLVLGEVNQGGDWIETLLRIKDPNINYLDIRGEGTKRARAEPVSALYEQGKVRHVGRFPALEEEMITWTGPPAPSPNRIDALVYTMKELMLQGQQPFIFV